MSSLMRFCFILAVVFATSCSNDGSSEVANRGTEPAYEEIKKAKWLIGSWKGSSAEGIFGESWQLTNDSVYNGKGYFIAGKDTVSSESLCILQLGNKLYYVPTIRQQNNGQPVRFEMTDGNDSTMMFENPAHDFPQRITYRRISSDSIVAAISGKLDGKESVQTFPMKRVN